MVAWAAVTGSISLESVVLFAIIFLWTPPHFWALALYKQGDYQEAGIPMLPNVAGEAATKLQILVYSVLLVAATLAPPLLGYSGLAYAAVAVVTGAWFIILALRLYGQTGVAMKKTGRRLFIYSLYYLAVIFLALLADDFLTRFGSW
jgi:protoheme IX farnesyltransferase